jgi:hypothetical protein
MNCTVLGTGPVRLPPRSLSYVPQHQRRKDTHLL